MKLSKSSVENIYPLSQMQQGLMFHTLANEGYPKYVQRLELDIQGEIDVPNMQSAFDRVVQDNEMLRTVFRWKNIEQPIQIVLKEINSTIHFEDLSDLPDDDKRRRIEDIAEQEWIDNKRLEEGPIIRLHLYRMSKGYYHLELTYHHLILDGWSQSVLLKELFDGYEQLTLGNSISRKEKTSYKEFIAWESSHVTGTEKEFWTDYFNEYNGNSYLRLDPIMQKGISSRTVVNTMSLSESEAEGLKRLAKESRITLTSVFYAAWAVLLRSYCSSNDLLFGTVMAVRPPGITGAESMMGPMINTLPLRVQLETCTVVQLAKQIHHTLLSLKEHESDSLSDIHSWCFKGNESELFETLLVVENYPLEEGLKNISNTINITKYRMHETTNYKLVLSINLLTDVSVSLEYDSGYFSKECTQGIMQHYLNILHQFTSNKNDKIQELCFLTDWEKKLIHNVNDTYTKFLQPMTIDGLFEKQVCTSPDKTALIYQDFSMSYMELGRMSNWIAKTILDELDHKDEIQFIGVMLERSFLMVAAMLGILKAGAVYVPIDSEYPKERVRYMIENSNMKMLITQGVNVHKFPGCKILTFDDKEWRNLPKSIDPVNNSSPEKPAYLIYTSGSTGVPKGIVISHRSISNTLIWRRNYYEFNESDAVLQIPSISFDSSVEDIFTPLISGASLVLPEQKRCHEIAYLGNLIQRHQVTHFLIVPSLYYVLLQEIGQALQGMRFVTVAGEICPDALIQMHFQTMGHVELYNEYGPAENSVCSTVHKLSEQDSGDIIGKPISNVQCHVVYQGALQPVGVAGDLYLAGDGLMSGYVDGSTKFYSINGVTHYPTGDQVMLDHNGNLRFLGRTDDQVKINGIRIELSEIRNFALQYPDIRLAEAVICKTSGGKMALAVCYTANTPVLEHLLQEYLSEYLPLSAVPGKFIYLDSMPLLPSGKVDKAKLAEVVTTKTEIACTKNGTPSNSVELKLCEIWRHYLNVDQIGIHDKFIELGGTSIQVIGIISRINKEFQADFKVSDMFKYVTIYQLAKEIQKDEVQTTETVSIYEY